ncbi:MAG: hypothetical protein RLZZ80_198 [Pseudomonadota bacterium]|jgi:uncharacterized protein
MYGRILLIMGLVAIALFMLRSALGKSKKPPPGKPGQSPHPKPSQRLVHCASCGAHLAESEAIWKAGRAYCCTDHVNQS